MWRSTKLWPSVIGPGPKGARVAWFLSGVGIAVIAAAALLRSATLSRMGSLESRESQVSRTFSRAFGETGKIQATLGTPPPPPDAALVRNARGEILPELYRDITAESGIQFTYQNGVERPDDYFILDMLGGGVAVFDYDGDGLPDIFV